MSPILIVSCFLAYIGLLFWIAYRTERLGTTKNRWVNNPYVYGLSLAVYCTAWTYFGSVGKAATSGIGFLPIYLGPTLMAPLWWFVLRKVIVISKHQRITSIADFLSARFGKSTWVGIIATIVAIFSIIPYISIQLKAIGLSYQILTSHTPAGAGERFQETGFFDDPAMFIALALALFTIFFGTRKLDPNERHEGLVAAVAFESIIKLIAFLTIGIFVVFGLYNGFGDLFEAGAMAQEVRQIFTLEGAGFNPWTWFWLTLLSMFAILLLPRQFHIGVVENADHRHLRKASWILPLYLLLINLFVLPIAVAGLLAFPEGAADPDTFVLSIPLIHQADGLALFAALGGFSAATSMVIVAVIALSIMINNNLVLPLLFRYTDQKVDKTKDFSHRLIGIRRVSIVFVLLFAYGYFKFVGLEYTLVSIGLISFAGVAQFAPAMFGGLYWKRATKKGAIAGLVGGFIIWAYCLPLPTLAETGIIGNQFIQDGLFGWTFLKPDALFGLEGLDQITHGAFWSLLINLGLFVGVSLSTRQNALEIAQSDLFVNIGSYINRKQEIDLIRREGDVAELINLLHRFTGTRRARISLKKFERNHGIRLNEQSTANAEFVQFVETQIAGSIGAASARTVIRSMVREDPISLEEMFQILDQTREIFQYSKALERKSSELETTTTQLRIANEQLKELDRLKADFITTVTHELRTPITAIKSLANILLENPELEESEKVRFLNILVTESDRIARLVNQVLDLEKIRSQESNLSRQVMDLREVVQQTYEGLKRWLADQRVSHHCELPGSGVPVLGDPDRLKQVLINLLSNAAKFSDPENGQIHISLETADNMAILEVQDNGLGIEEKDQDLIFERFSQLNNDQSGKPRGSGLGLAITRQIVERHKGTIRVESQPNTGARFIISLPLYLDETLTDVTVKP